MALLLKKPIKRELLRMAEQRGKYKDRPIIVELLPGDDLSFRIKGTKKSYVIFLGHCYRLAQLMQAEHDYKTAMERYKQRKAIGQRSKKPNRPNLPYMPVYYKALG